MVGFRGDSWMSYDNERSVALKAEFAYDAGLAGVTIIILSYSPLIILSYLSNLSYSSYFFSLISKLQVMTWSIDTDDFEGICNGPKFPLLRTLNHALHNRYVEPGVHKSFHPGWEHVE